MKIVVTGHTGFKGAWLSLLLTARGHEVYGISLKPPENSLFNLLGKELKFARDIRLDIRDRPSLEILIYEIQPDYIFHLAAQPLVSEGYLNPVETMDVNVTGTLNILSSGFRIDSLKGFSIITTDKVYRNTIIQERFTEESPLGGRDPYSASKAMADILSQSWAQSYQGKPISIARAGNVIGGGDFAVGRLIPDMVNSLFQNLELNLRNAGATRPWQHILDCLNGYILAAEHLLATNLSNTWNFGPEEIDFRAVSEVVHEFTQNWGTTNLQINFNSPNEKFHESQDLALDSSKAKSLLGWSNRFQFVESIKLTSNWYKQVLNKELSAFEACRRDIELAELSFKIF